MTHQHQLDQVQQNVELDLRPQGDELEKPVRFILAMSISIQYAMSSWLLALVNISEIVFAWSSLKLQSKKRCRLVDTDGLECVAGSLTSP